MLLSPPCEQSSSWSELWLRTWLWCTSSFFITLRAVWARPPRAVTDSPERLTNWSTGLISGWVTDWLVDCLFCPLGRAGWWAGCDTESHHRGLSRKPVVGGYSPLTLLVWQPLVVKRLAGKHTPVQQLVIFLQARMAENKKKNALSS